MKLGHPSPQRPPWHTASLPGDKSTRSALKFPALPIRLDAPSQAKSMQPLWPCDLRCRTHARSLKSNTIHRAKPATLVTTPSPAQRREQSVRPSVPPGPRSRKRQRRRGPGSPGTRGSRVRACCCGAHNSMQMREERPQHARRVDLQRARLGQSDTAPTRRHALTSACSRTPLGARGSLSRLHASVSQGAVLAAKPRTSSAFRRSVADPLFKLGTAAPSPHKNR